MSKIGVVSNETKKQIADMNMEINYFHQKLSSFRKLNIVDSKVCESLEKILEDIDVLLENPVEVPTNSSNKTDCDIDFTKQHIERYYFCQCCQESFVNSAAKLQKHISKPNHIISTQLHQAGNSKKLKQIILKDNKSREDMLEIQAAQEIIKAAIKGQKEKKKEKRLQAKVLPRKLQNLMKSNLEQSLKKDAVEGTQLKRIPIYEDIKKALTNTIKSHYPNMKLYCFGSRISGLGSKESDLDIYVDIDNQYNKYSSATFNVIEDIRKIQGCLARNPEEWKKIKTVTSARVPIIRTYNSKLKIACDLSFSNGLSDCNTSLLQYFFEVQPICHKLSFFMKKWIRSTSFSDQFSTYTAVLMVVFFLQSLKLLPSVRQLQECVEPKLIGPWQCNFKKGNLEEFGIAKVSQKSGYILELILELLEFYRSFKYDVHVVCPYEGVAIERKGFNTKTDKLERYHAYREKCVGSLAFQIDKPICVQDPFELNHNTAKGISKETLKLFTNQLSLSVQELIV